MRVAVEESPEVFKPIVLSIHIHSTLERSMLVSLAGWNVSIPKLLEKDGKDTMDAAFDFLAALAKALQQT